MVPVQRDPLSDTFSALADPTRRAILANLASGSKTVTELAEPFELSLPAISKHLKVLENARLVKRSRQAQFRPCTLHPRPLEEVDRWLDQYRRLFEASFERLDEYLEFLQAKEENSE